VNPSSIRSRRRLALRLATIGVVAGITLGVAGTAATAAITNTVRTKYVEITGWCVEGKAQMNTSLTTPTAYGYAWSMDQPCSTTKSVQNVGSLSVYVYSFLGGSICGSSSIVSNTTAPAANVSVGLAKNCGNGNYQGRTTAGIYLGGYTYGTGVLTPYAAFP